MLKQLAQVVTLATAAYATSGHAGPGSSYASKPRAYSSDSSLEALFGPHLSPGTEIASSSDANFSTVVGTRWSAWETPDWSGAIKPANISDLGVIVSASVI
jgi:hypothetical protein